MDSIIGVIKEDAGSLDYSSFVQGQNLCRALYPKP